MGVPSQTDSAVKAKIDGDMMNCCVQSPSKQNDANNFRYETNSETTSTNSEYFVACYDPSLTDGYSCATDRAQNSIYACFPPVGDQIPNCRSSCLRGHPQDYSFTLQSPLADPSFPIAERGVELYENFGLDVNVRPDSGNYGKDKSKISCIADLGRKVSLFGNVDFEILICNATTACSYGTQKIINVVPNSIVYQLNVYYTYFNGMYNYFGNAGVTFVFGGEVKQYIAGEMESLPEVGYEDNGSTRIYYISDYLNRSPTSNPEGLKLPNNINTAANVYCDWDFPAYSSMFPVSFKHQYFNTGDSSSYAWNCDTGHQNSGPTNTPNDCYGSGCKSMYVPPHMEVTSISYFGDWPNFVTGTYTNKIRAEYSAYNNGTFPAFGMDTVPSNSGDDTSSRNAVVKIPSASLYAISVRVRQDSYFYNRFVSSADSGFAPEIMLIPGIQNAASFPGKLSVGSILESLSDPLQTIQNPNNFWSSKNPYWTEDFGTVKINVKYEPGQVLYGISNAPPPSAPMPPILAYDPKTGEYTCDTKESGSSFAVSKISKLPIIKNIIGSSLAFGRSLKRTTSNIVSGSGSDGGEYRITNFDVISGVYSIEWLYVLYYCAMNGRAIVQYNSDSMQYVTANCTSSNSTSNPRTCDKECLLFRDDYTYSGGNKGICAADIVMNAYCGMRNISFAYAPWRGGSTSSTNECSCITSQNACPTLNDPALCSTSYDNTASYLTASQNTDCGDITICNYCKNVAFQANIAALGACATGNNTINYGNSSCASDNTCTEDGGTSTQTTTTISINYLLLLAVIILAIIFVMVVYATWKSFGK
jgi:hypothetical protein